MLPRHLTDEELFAIYLCVFNFIDSSSDEDEEDEDYEDGGDDESALGLRGDSSIGNEKHDWHPEKWVEGSSDLHARITRWTAEVAAQEAIGSRKRAATEDTATLTGIKQPPDAKPRRRLGASPRRVRE